MASIQIYTIRDKHTGLFMGNKDSKGVNSRAWGETPRCWYGSTAGAKRGLSALNYRLPYWWRVYGNGRKCPHEFEIVEFQASGPNRIVN